MTQPTDDWTPPLSILPQVESPAGSSIIDDLRRIQQDADGNAVTIRALVEGLRERGLLVVTIVLAVPFMLPITLPVLSLPFGFFIFMVGVGLVSERTPWIPKRLMEKPISARVLDLLIRRIGSFHRFVQRIARARCTFLVNRWGLRLAGLNLASAAIALSLPIPPIIPLSNTIPALGVLFLSVALLERDGVIAALGHALCVFAWVYFYLWWEVLKLAFHEIWIRIAPYF